MAGYLHLTQTLRHANARIRTARELQARWEALPPEDQAQAKVEWDAVKGALAAVRARLEYGPRGFAREFKAAYRGTEAAPVEDARPVGDLVRELHDATTALRNKLDAAA